MTFKVIVAGSRSLIPNDARIKRVKTLTRKYWDYDNNKPIGDGLILVTGTAQGADQIPYVMRSAYGIPILEFPALWGDIEGKPPEQIGIRRDGEKYWKGAGHYRNRQMAEYADALIAFWDGESPGTRNMINTAEKLGLAIRVIMY